MKVGSWMQWMHLKRWGRIHWTHWTHWTHRLLKLVNLQNAKNKISISRPRYVVKNYIITKSCFIWVLYLHNILCFPSQIKQIHEQKRKNFVTGNWKAFLFHLIHSFFFLTEYQFVKLNWIMDQKADSFYMLVNCHLYMSGQTPPPLTHTISLPLNLLQK